MSCFQGVYSEHGRNKKPMLKQHQNAGVIPLCVFPEGVKEFENETEVVLYLTALKCNSFSDYFAVQFAATPSLVQPGQKQRMGMMELPKE